MAKKIAVLVRDRQGEALRMSLGLTLMDDIIEIFVLDRKVEETQENIQNMAAMKGYEMNLYTNYKGNKDMKYLSTEEMAEKLSEYDHVLPY